MKFVLDFIHIQEKNKTLYSENKEACPHKLWWKHGSTCIFKLCLMRDEVNIFSMEKRLALFHKVGSIRNPQPSYFMSKYLYQRDFCIYVFCILYIYIFNMYLSTISMVPKEQESRGWPGFLRITQKFSLMVQCEWKVNVGHFHRH